MCTCRVGLQYKRFIHAINSIKLFGFILGLRGTKNIGRLKTRLKPSSSAWEREKSSSFARFSMRRGLCNESTQTFIKCTARISPSGFGSLLVLADGNAGRGKDSLLKGVGRKISRGVGRNGKIKTEK